MKTQTKTILSSVLVIVLCFALMTGATFALFTSESDTNIAVNAGNIEVVATASIYGAWSAKWEDGGYKQENVGTPQKVIRTEQDGQFQFTNGGTASIEGGVVKLSNITPGDGVRVLVEIANTSTIDIQYRVSIAAVTGADFFKSFVTAVYADEYATELYATGWTFAEVGTTVLPSAYVDIELPITVDDFQGKSCDIVVTVQAIQGNAHVSDDTVFVETEQELDDALNTDNANIILMKDIATNGTISVTGKNVSFDLGNYSVTNTASTNEPTISVQDGASVTFSGNGTVENTSSGNAAVYVAKGGEATIEGGTFLRNNANDSNYYVIENYGTMTINGGTFYHEGGKLGGTITLVANKVGGIMTINGGTFGGMNIAVKNEDADLTITGGTFDAIGNTSGNNLAQSLQNHGTATIKGGTFEQMVANLADGSVGMLTIEGGVFNGKVRSQFDGGSNVPVLTIKDGQAMSRSVEQTVPEFFADIEAANGAKVVIEGGLFHAKLARGYTSEDNKTYGTFEISGGRYYNVPSNSYLPEGHVFKYDAETKTFYVGEGTTTMQIRVNGGSYYVASFAEAISYLQSFSEDEITGIPNIYITKSLTDNLVVPAGVSIALYVVGTPTITSAIDAPVITVEAGGALIPYTSIGAYNVVNTFAGQPAIYVEEGGTADVSAITTTNVTDAPAIINKGTLTLGDGTLSATATANKITVSNSVLNYGKMDIYGGTYGDVVAEKGSTLGIFGGTFEGNLTLNGTTEIFNVYDTAKGTVKLSPTFKGTLTYNENVQISGGTFHHEPNSQCVVTGFSVVNNDNGTWTVAAGVILIHDGQVYPCTLSEMLQKMAGLTGAITIVLNANYEANIVVPADVTLTLNLNNYTLTNATEDHTITVSEGGSLTISAEGNVVNNSEGKAAIYVKGSLTVSNGTIEHSKDDAIVVEDGGAVKISGGTINGNVTINCSAPTISNGTFNGVVTITADTVAISGGTFNGSLYIEGETIKLTGGKYEYDVEIKASVLTSISGTGNAKTFNGNLKINGGNVEITAAYSNISQNVTPKAVTFGGTVTIENAGTVTISGGTYQQSVSISSESVLIKNTSVTTTKGTTVMAPTFAGTVTITSEDITAIGGKFMSKDITLGEGYTWSEVDTDGYYSVVKENA